MSTITTSQFKRIAELAQDRWGLHLTDKKLQLVSNRLASFLRKHKRYNEIDEYLDHLESEADEEDKLIFFDILSTNVTSFFRERAHFDYVEREFYTALNQGNITLPGKKIRIWSAACSTGPEPYSLAMHVLEQLDNPGQWDIKILATDLSNSAVAKAKAAVYPQSMVEQLDQSLVRKYFLRGKGDNADSVKVADKVRSMVSIGRMNLMEPFPFKGPFDIIFCRNVMIYFDRDTRQDLVMRMHNVLRPGGILAIGSAETLSGLDTPFKTVQASVYVR